MNNILKNSNKYLIFNFLKGRLLPKTALSRSTVYLKWAEWLSSIANRVLWWKDCRLWLAARGSKMAFMWANGPANYPLASGHARTPEVWLAEKWFRMSSFITPWALPLSMNVRRDCTWMVLLGWNVWKMEFGVRLFRYAENQIDQKFKFGNFMDNCRDIEIQKKTDNKQWN